MGLRFTILSSGSTGNATVVTNGDCTLLVDAGLSAKRLEQLMRERNVNGSDIEAIFVTHEHSDHIKGLGVLSRKYNLPIYANRKTWEELDRLIGDVDVERRRIFETGERLRFGTMTVESYGISHDAAEPVGYCFYDGGEKLGLATDLGYMSAKVKEKLMDSDVLVLETNHDVEMLRMGRYPWSVKRRILGDTGHLSNESAGEALCDILDGKTRRVYLAHLSRDHNLMDLARLTVNNMIRERVGAKRANQVRLMDTYYDRPTPWDALSAAE
jgi:phosphoribosyl 1,2-cyclic phosphodiesterase